MNIGRLKLIKPKQNRKKQKKSEMNNINRKKNVKKTKQFVCKDKTIKKNDTNIY